MHNLYYAVLLTIITSPSLLSADNEHWNVNPLYQSKESEKKRVDNPHYDPNAKANELKQNLFNDINRQNTANELPKLDEPLRLKPKSITNIFKTVNCKSAHRCIKAIFSAKKEELSESTTRKAIEESIKGSEEKINPDIIKKYLEVAMINNKAIIASFERLESKIRQGPADQCTGYEERLKTMINNNLHEFQNHPMCTFG